MPFYKIDELEKIREGVSPLAEIQKVVGEFMKVAIVTYYKGEGATPHFHPNDEQFVYVLEGQRASIVGDEEQIVGPGDFIYIPRNTRHGGRTITDKAVMFIAKSPAGDGVLGQDYNKALDAEDVTGRLEERLKELS